MRKLSARKWLHKVANIGPGCWEWKGFKDCDGYGRTSLNVEGKKEQQANRVAFIRCIGPIPEGLSVCHTCDNPACVRPSHLFLGSQVDNMIDCTNKGRRRGAVGERNQGAKITAEDVIDIRYLKRVGATTNALAEAFELAPITIQQINRRWIWAHVA